MLPPGLFSSRDTELERAQKKCIYMSFSVTQTEIMCRYWFGPIFKNAKLFHNESW